MQLYIASVKRHPSQMKNCGCAPSLHVTPREDADLNLVKSLW